MAPRVDRASGLDVRQPRGSIHFEPYACHRTLSMPHNRRHVLVTALALLSTVACGNSELEHRRDEVAAAGREVMPFDLDATTHVFERTEDGGLQTVVADSDDPEQVALIRSHLAEEAERFQRGDFHDPAMIHGDDMAGLHTLMMGHDRVTIEYREIPRGGEIRYSSADPALIAAIQQWFAAQLLDHGEHAQAHR